MLGVRQGRIQSVDGLDADDLADRLGCEATGEPELLAEARAIARTRGVPETRAMGSAKEMLQQAVHRWLTDPDRELAIDDDEPPEIDGPTISITHALVELVLADTEQKVAAAVLPDHEVVLRRSDGFLELYAPLRLSEEADLIVAGITGSATASEIARGSNHHPDEVLRLIAALVATGVLEASQPAPPVDDLDWPGTDLDLDGPTRRKIPVWMIAAAAGVVLVIVIVAFLLLGGDRDADATAAAGAGDWGVVVEMGCEPEDLQRMLRKRNLERKTLRTVKADPANGDSCFRLVWGSFANREAAEAAIGEIPGGLVEEGFEPHVIEVTEGETSAELGSGE